MKARGGLVGAVLVGLMATVAPTASAATVKSVSIVGTWTMRNCQGLGLPVVTGMVAPVPTASPGPKGEPRVNINPNQGRACDFELSSTTCVKTSAGAKVGPSDLCRVLAAGTVWGFCGYATGVGTTGIIDLSGGKDTKTVGFHLTFVGTEVVVSGGNADTNLHGELAAVASTGSCTDATATTFTLAGTALYKDLR